MEAELDPRFSAPGASAIPWDETVEVLESAEMSWISTVRPDGRPHVTPLVAVWHDGTLSFTTGPTEQKARNLDRNPRVCVTTSSGTWASGIDVVVEGTAERITDAALLGELAARWADKWDGRWQYEVVGDEFEGSGIRSHCFAVRPDKVLAFRKGEFSQTRYRAP